MSELRNRLIRDLKLAGLADGTSEAYVRAVYQLTGYYMIRPDQLTERQVQDYLLYVRDDLGVAKGTFLPMFHGLKFFYRNTLGYEWALFTKKKSVTHARNGSPMSAAMTIAVA
jgi:integrase/recombinase XerD